MKSILSLLIFCTISIGFNAQTSPIKFPIALDTAAFFYQTYSAGLDITSYRSPKGDLRMLTSKVLKPPFGVTMHKYFEVDSVWYSINPFDANYTYHVEGSDASITLENGTVLGGPDVKLISDDIKPGYGFKTLGIIYIDQNIVNTLCRVLIKEISVNGKKISIPRRHAKIYRRSFRAISNSRDGLPQLKQVRGLP